MFLATRLGRVAAVALPSAGTAVAFVVMSRYNLIGDEPVWVILVLLALAAVIGESMSRLLATDPNGWKLHAGVGLQCLAVAAVIYAIGWGPTLAIGFLFIAARARHRGLPGLAHRRHLDRHRDAGRPDRHRCRVLSTRMCPRRRCRASPSSAS